MSLQLRALLRRNDKPVALAVFEHCVGPPRLFLWRTFEFHAALLQLRICLVDVVARIRHVHKRSDPFFVPFRREQHHSRFRFRHAQFDPALFPVERLIGNDREPEFVRVKIQGPVLIGHGDTDEFDLLNHDERNVNQRPRLRPEATYIC